MITKDAKQKIIQTFGINNKDTGSPEVQIALITARIDYLAEHFQKQPRDHASRRGLLKLVGQRRDFLSYLKTRDEARYENITQKLGLRK